nr:MAG TPA: hypothetical protein [Caudoviricetes sp.]
MTGGALVSRYPKYVSRDFKFFYKSIYMLKYIFEQCKLKTK